MVRVLRELVREQCESRTALISFIRLKKTVLELIAVYLPQKSMLETNAWVARPSCQLPLTLG